jgi:Na+/H+ antiporter NhaA
VLVAALAAVAWVNIDAPSYERVWETVLKIRVGHAGISQDLRPWVNDGLMTFFFLVLGLEARRELDLGELRDRRRLAAPAAASFVVIASACTHPVKIVALLVSLGILAAVAVARFRHVRNGIVYVTLGTAAWVALLKSGVDPVIVGGAIGLLSIAYPAGRGDLERATDLVRLFREQPTPQLAHSANESVRIALSPNERLQQLYRPASTYVIVPLFALANAGFVVNGHFLVQAYTSPVTLGILVGYVLGKPIGTASFTWLLARLSPAGVRPPVGWASVDGGGVIAGTGFTVSLLIATLAFNGVELQEAKLGVLTAALCAAALTWITFRIDSRRRLGHRQLTGTARAAVASVDAHASRPRRQDDEGLPASGRRVVALEGRRGDRP